MDDSPDLVLEVGTISAFRIYGGRALNDRYSLWDICDACEQVTSDAYQVLFEQGYEYKPVIQKMFPDALNPDVLLIDVVRINPSYRGRRLGLLGARRLMDILGTGVGPCPCKALPPPVQRSP